MPTLFAVSTEDAIAYSAMVAAILAALVTGMVTGLRQLRAAARAEDDADHAAWKLRIREMADEQAVLVTRMASMEAEAREFYSLLPGARKRADEYESGVQANAARLNTLEARLVAMEKQTHA